MGAETTNGSDKQRADMHDLLSATPPLPLQTQTSPDSWQIVWHQTAASLQTLFKDCDKANMLHLRRRKTRGYKPSLHPHFRSEVDVETGLIEVMLRSEVSAPDDKLRASAFISFTAHDGVASCPDLEASLTLGDYAKTLPIVNDEVVFPAIELNDICKALENIQTNLEFRLHTAS